MYRAVSLAAMFAVSLLSATQAGADEPVPAPPSESSAEPAEKTPDTQQSTDEAADPTWFGMGFESRQERFRRDMGVSNGQPAGRGGPAGGAGKGGGR